METRRKSALSDVRVLAAESIPNLWKIGGEALAADFGVPASLRLTDRAEEARDGVARGKKNLEVLREIIQMFDSGPTLS